MSLTMKMTTLCYIEKDSLEEILKILYDAKNMVDI